eukprot:7376887-Prymnesium_polylepis.2
MLLQPVHEHRRTHRQTHHRKLREVEPAARGWRTKVEPAKSSASRATRPWRRSGGPRAGSLSLEPDQVGQFSQAEVRLHGSNEDQEGDEEYGTAAHRNLGTDGGGLPSTAQRTAKG